MSNWDSAYKRQVIHGNPCACSTDLNMSWLSLTVKEQNHVPCLAVSIWFIHGEWPSLEELCCHFAFQIICSRMLLWKPVNSSIVMHDAMVRDVSELAYKNSQLKANIQYASFSDITCFNKTHQHLKYCAFKLSVTMCRASLFPDI